MSDFESAVNYVLLREGILTENPKDRGGLTKYGISLRFLRHLPADALKRYGIFDHEIDESTIRNLTLTQAKAIYKGEYWDHAPFEKILNQEHCNYIFDMAVNMGIAPAIKCVQRACWAVMKKWDILVDDGILGDKTLEAIQRCGFMIMPPMRSERAALYREIIKEYPDQAEFLKGWYNRAYG